MYSDIWTNDKSLRKTVPIKITTESNVEYWINEKDELIGVAVNFEVADDVHIELTRDNWMLFLQKVLHLTDIRDIEEKLSDFLKGDAPYIAFEKSLEQEKIEYKKAAFFDVDFD